MQKGRSLQTPGRVASAPNADMRSTCKASTRPTCAYLIEDNVEIVLHLDGGVRIIELAHHDPLRGQQRAEDLYQNVRVEILRWALE